MRDTHWLSLLFGSRRCGDCFVGRGIQCLRPSDHHLVFGSVTPTDGLRGVWICRIVGTVIKVEVDHHPAAFLHQYWILEPILQLPVEIVMWHGEQNLPPAICVH